MDAHLNRLTPRMDVLARAVMSILLFLPGSPLNAETYYEIRGRVTDGSGKPIPGATLTVRMVGWDWSRTYQSNANGFFRLTALTDRRTYWVACDAPNRVTTYFLQTVQGGNCIRKDVQLLSPKEFSQQNPSIPLAYNGSLEALSAIDAYNQGVTFFNAQNYQKAQPFLSQADQLFSAALVQAEDPTTRVNFSTALANSQRLRGCALTELGKIDPTRRSEFYKEAEPLLWKSLEAHTSDTIVYLYLLEILKSRPDDGSRAKADSIYVNQSPVVSFNRGVTAFNAGEFEQAARCFRDTLALAPDFAEAHYLLALCEGEAGNSKELQHHLLEYLKLSPEGKNAETARKRLSTITTR